MSLTEEEKKQIVDYRLEKSKRTLEDALKIIELKMWVTQPIGYIMLHIMQCRHCLSTII